MKTKEEHFEASSESKKKEVLGIHYEKKGVIDKLMTYFGLDDAIALIALFLGLLYYFFPFESQFLKDFHSELISIGITVLILGNANQYMEIQAEKKRLILQMGSPDNSIAIEAVRQIKNNGWLLDGTLVNAFLQEANLKNAFMLGVRLDKACLMFTNFEAADMRYGHFKDADMLTANLKQAYLENSDLERVSMFRADLGGAFLKEAHLDGADLFEANLEGADLTGIFYNDDTKWLGATYNTGLHGTKFPDNFDPIEKGMICTDDPKGPQKQTSGNHTL